MTKENDATSVFSRLGNIRDHLKKAGTDIASATKAGLLEASAEARGFVSDVKSEIRTSVADARESFIQHEADWAYKTALEKGFSPEQAEAIRDFWTQVIPFSPKPAEIDEDGGPSSSI